MSNRVSLHAPEGLEDRAEDISEQHDRVKSDVMREALQLGLEEMEQNSSLSAITSTAGVALTAAGATLVMVAAAIPGSFGLHSGALVLLLAAVLLASEQIRSGVGI